MNKLSYLREQVEQGLAKLLGGQLLAIQGQDEATLDWEGGSVDGEKMRESRNGV